VARKRRRSGGRKRRATSRRRSSPRASRRGLALPELLIGGGAGIGLAAIAQMALGKIAPDSEMGKKIQSLLMAYGPLGGAGLVWLLGKFGKSQTARNLTMPALVGGGIMTVLGILMAPKGAGARRLRGSGASAARATIAGSGAKMHYLPGAGASAARATIAG
jgi:hypothetical protein